MKFTYNDIVRVKADAPPEFRQGDKAWIVAVFETAEGLTYRSFAAGPIYTIEFEDGEATDIEEFFLDAAEL